MRPNLRASNDVREEGPSKLPRSNCNLAILFLAMIVVGLSTRHPRVRQALLSGDATALPRTLAPPPVFVAELPVEASHVYYGKLGLGSDLGFEQVGLLSRLFMSDDKTSLLDPRGVAAGTRSTNPREPALGLLL